MDEMSMVKIPEITLRGGVRAMPVVAMGTAVLPFSPAETKAAIVHAIELGYRHFDTASLYETERPLGEAVAEALRLGLVASREDLFVTTKLWSDQAHPELVLPALKNSLRDLEMEYVDLYLIHIPISSKPGSTPRFPIKREEVMSMDLKSVWEAMEECQRIGLTRSIGVSNFSQHMLEKLLLTATVPPAVNQVEMNVAWQQSSLREYCKEKGIHVTAYSPLGGSGGPLAGNQMLGTEIIRKMAKSRGKTAAQICLRWLHQQGVSLVVKSLRKEMLKENLQMFGWELSDDECKIISQFPPHKRLNLNKMLSVEGKLSLDLSDYEFP